MHQHKYGFRRTKFPTGYRTCSCSFSRRAHTRTTHSSISWTAQRTRSRASSSALMAALSNSTARNSKFKLPSSWVAPSPAPLTSSWLRVRICLCAVVWETPYLVWMWVQHSSSCNHVDESVFPRWCCIYHVCSLYTSTCARVSFRMSAAALCCALRTSHSYMWHVTNSVEI